MKNILYVSIPESQSIQVLQLSNNGVLNFIQRINVNKEIQPMYIYQKKNILYAGLRPYPKILTFSISINGNLEQINETLIPGTPNYITVDLKYNSIFCSSYHSGFLSIIPINKDGIPKKIPIKTLNNLDGCHSANIHPSNSLLFVPALKKNKIYIYNLINKHLLLNNKQKFLNTGYQSGPRHMSFHPNKKHIYSINELNSTIDVWELNIFKNKIFHVERLDLMPNKYIGKRWAADIHLTKSGKFLYACDRALSIISIFKVNSKNGCIKNIGHCITEMQPRSFCIDNTNNFLIIAGQKSHIISIYKISSSTGLLKKINKYHIQKGVIWISLYQS